MASCNAVLKSESKSELRQVSNSAQTQHFSSPELLLDLYMPEMALFSKSTIITGIHGLENFINDSLAVLQIISLMPLLP